MRREKILLLALMMAGSFFMASFVYSANTDIIINEIGAYPTSTHEWVELWNKGNEPVDLDNWVFWENNTNHRLSVTGTSDSIVAAGEYAVIAQKGDQFRKDYPNFIGSIFDSTWTSLSESGEEIGLKDGNGNFIEQFTYLPTTNFSLERKNPGLADYTATNWQEHMSGHTLGAVNSNVTGVGAGNGSGTGETAVTSSTTGDGSAAANSAVNTALWAGLRLNEIMIDPESGAEWVEIFNPGASSVDLSGGTLCDSRTATDCVIASPTSTIGAGGWLVIYLSSARLNNNGDAVILKNPSGAVADRVVYGSGGVGLPKEGQTLARRVDGQKSGNDSRDWAVTTVATPGAANSIVAPVVATESSAQASGGGGSSSGSSVSKSVKVPVSTSTLAVVGGSPVVFNEVFPNPGGADAAGEFVEMKNISATATVSLVGWRIETTGGQRFVVASTTLGPGAIAVWYRAVSGLVLKNSTETLTLFNERGVAVDRLLYEIAPEGQSYNRKSVGGWGWSRSPTPGQENKIVMPDSVKIIWQISAPKSGLAGRELNFDATGSTDPRGGAWLFSWNFGDGTLIDGGRVSQVFAREGNYTITVSATSTAGTVGQRLVLVRIGSRIMTQANQVVISEAFPNPLGADTMEFVEIFNGSVTSTQIGGWSLVSGDKKFVIPENTTINSGGFLVFKRLVTGIALNNRGGALELHDANDDLIDEVTYAASKEGKSYTLGPEEEWRWVTPTPGASWSAEDWEAADKGVKTAEVKLVTAPNKQKKTVVKKTVSKNSGTIQTIVGIVSALPGTLGSQYFYLTSADGGVQVFQSKKDWPSLQIGDEVAARGRLHAVRGVSRLTVAAASDIDILDSEKALVPERLASGDAVNWPSGSLVEVQGEITELKSSYGYIDDGAGDVLVYFKSGAKINSKQFKLGQRVRVVGILERTTKGARVLPRSLGDIEVMVSSSESVVSQGSATSMPATEKYLTATAGGVTTLLLGFLARARGALLVGGVKKVVKVAVAVFKRNQG